MVRAKRVIALIALSLAVNLISAAQDTDLETGKEGSRTSQTTKGDGTRGKEAMTWPPKDVTLDDDPSLWPGHLQPIGANVPNKEVTVLNGFPSPEEFLRNYAIPSVPVLFKGAVTDSVAFKNWNSDDYFRKFPESDTDTLMIETRKKEIRNYPVDDVTMTQFLDRYTKEDIYMVEAVPKFVRKDVPMPKALLCEPIAKTVVDMVMWFSSGGTKSVLHNDDVDNINCLYDGKKELVFISYQKYRTKVTLDHPEGSYSSMDVEAVDFTKFPGMREVEYVRVNMSAGDCLYIPYRWFHQVNSYGRNIAVNVWWEHNLRNYINALSEGCGNLSEDSTLDDVDIQAQQESSPIEELQVFVSEDKDNVVNFEDFEARMRQDQLFKEALLWTEECQQLLREVFEVLDQNKDELLTKEDFDGLTKEMEQELEEETMDKIDHLKAIHINQVADLREFVAADVASGKAENYVEHMKKMLEQIYEENGTRTAPGSPGNGHEEL